MIPALPRTSVPVPIAIPVAFPAVAFSVEGGVAVVSVRQHIQDGSDTQSGIDTVALRCVLSEITDLPDCPSVILDFSGAAWLGSPVLPVLIDALRCIRAVNCRLILCGCPARFIRALEITRLVCVFELTGTVAEARGMLKAEARGMMERMGRPDRGP